MSSQPRGGNKVDLGALARDVRYEIKANELPQELESRLRREEVREQHELAKEKVILWAVWAA